VGCKLEIKQIKYIVDTKCLATLQV
jgi:hypothetical protein